LWVNQAEIPGNGIDDDANGCVDDIHGCRFMNPNATTQAVCGYPQATVPDGAVVDDDGESGFGNHSHGTLVSGILGATGNNAEGITGVAWNVKIMVIKVLDCGGPGGLPSGNMDDVRRGIEYATRMGAKVINLSLASRPDDLSADQPGLRAAIETARDENVIIVAAAGNISGSNPAPGYPAAYTQYENVIGVGASDWRAGNVWAQFSRYGNGIDLAAPGTSISSTIRSDLNGVDLYGSVNGGTSYSTPLVSGMFALMAARNPNLPFQAYVDAAYATAQAAAAAPHGGNWAGHGIIDAGAAIQRIPMIITGSALHDWLDLPAGRVVQARIGGRICGSTVSESFGTSRISRFELTVDADAVNAGCGMPGREVRLFIDGQPAVPGYPWGGQDEPLAHISQDVSTVSPDPGPIVVQPMSTGWNNIAHFDQTGPIPSAFSYLPGSWTAAYTWDPLVPAVGGGFGEYARAIKGAPDVLNDWDVAQRYQAYWVDATTDTVASSVNPNPPKGRHAFFEPGWNNFVYTGTSMAVEDALENLRGLYTTVLYHDNGTGEWATYVPDRARPLNGFGGLLNMRVYWIFMNGAGGFTMD
jgi:subtilisin family serine protease